MPVSAGFAFMSTLTGAGLDTVAPGVGVADAPLPSPAGAAAGAAAPAAVEAEEATAAAGFAPGPTAPGFDCAPAANGNTKPASAKPRTKVTRRCMRDFPSFRECLRSAHRPPWRRCAYVILRRRRNKSALSLVSAARPWQQQQGRGGGERMRPKAVAFSVR